MGNDCQDIDFNSYLLLPGAILATTWEGEAERKALELAVEYVNNDTNILPSTRLSIIVNYTAILDPLSNVQKGMVS